MMTAFVINLVSEVYAIFSESVVIRRNYRGVLIGRTLNLNCCTQQANCNSGLPPPYYYKNAENDLNISVRNISLNRYTYFFVSYIIVISDRIGHTLLNIIVFIY